MELFPPIPLASWQDTKQTLHRFCQVVGKLRLAASVRRNHWWNVPFHLTGRGITTRPMGQVDGNPIFTIDFDFIDHQLRIHTLDGRVVTVPLQGQSVASFHNQTLQVLAELGITVTIVHPYLRPARRRPTLRRRHRTRQLRPGLGYPLLAGPEPGQPGPGGVRGPVLEQGQPGPSFLAHLRHRPYPLCRPPDRPAGDRRPGDPGGVLAGGDQLRLLVRRRPLPRAGVLQLHRPGAGLAEVPLQPAAAWWDRATAAIWPSYATTTPAQPPIPGPACSASTRAPTRPAPDSPAGTSGAWPVPAGSLTRSSAGPTAESSRPQLIPLLPAWRRRCSRPSSSGGCRDGCSLRFRRLWADLLLAPFPVLPATCREAVDPCCSTASMSRTTASLKSTARWLGRRKLGRDLLGPASWPPRSHYRDGHLDRAGTGRRYRRGPAVTSHRALAAAAPPADPVRPAARRPVAPPVLAAAGDIACDPPAAASTAATAATACHMGATARLVRRLDPQVVLTLGDNQYENGTLAKFRRSYHRSWGGSRAAPDRPRQPRLPDRQGRRLLRLLRPGGRPPSRGYYSFDVGGWHLIALNSECAQVGGCATGSRQERWLQADLAAHPARCVLAYWHKPRFSSGMHGNDAAYTALWQALYAAGAELVLVGHDHDYERFAPQTPVAGWIGPEGSASSWSAPAARPTTASGPSGLTVRSATAAPSGSCGSPCGHPAMPGALCPSPASGSPTPATAAATEVRQRLHECRSGNGCMLSASWPQLDHPAPPPPLTFSITPAGGRAVGVARVMDHPRDAAAAVPGGSAIPARPRCGDVDQGGGGHRAKQHPSKNGNAGQDQHQNPDPE